MSVKLAINLCKIFTSLLVICALVNYSLARGAKFNCLKCSKICKDGKVFWGTMAIYCSRCNTICDMTKTAIDPWLPITKVVNKRKFNATIDDLNTTKKPSPGQQGRSMGDTENLPKESGSAWWGRRR